MSHRFALIPACELAYQFHKRRGEEDAAQQVRLRAEAHNDILVQAGAERRLVAHTDVFLSPRVTEGFKNQLRRRLRGISRLKHVWICRKEVKQFPDDPAYVFIIETGFSGREDKVITEIVQALADMEGLTSIFVVGKYGELKEIARAALKPAERLF